MKQAMLGSGHFLFHNKPIVLRSWSADVELTKEEVKSVPAWVRIHKLPLKFCGKSLSKIANLVGQYVKSDEATEQKTRLGFARVMLELKLGQKCKLLGHEKEKCRRGKPVQTKPNTQKVQKSLDEETRSPVRPVRATRQGNVNSDQQLSPTYKECIEDCNLSEMPSTGAFYTWNNKQPPETRIYSRLDRMFVNHEWTIQFPEYYANFLPEGQFDHTPCLVTTTAHTHTQPHTRSFKYYNMWSSAPDFKECVHNWLAQSITWTKMYGIVRKLKLLKPILKQLNRAHFSDVENKSDQVQAKLTHIQQQLVSNPGDEDLKKAKAHWMTEGDSNSAYFHGVIKARRNKNAILQIKDHMGQLYTEEYGIQEAFLEYYKLLLGTSQILKQVNSTLLTLIPKVASPLSVLDYRPIACCNITYKCISKLICNRLALVLPEIISQNQGGFIQGRSIMENILIYQDLIRMYEKQVLQFPDMFRGWIMQCVTNATYSINLNRNMFGFFQGAKGVETGRPTLSPSVHLLYGVPDQIIAMLYI
ncbi:uncharacterized protein LOC141617161 [Silene latifolia]|uniref:uncharacterized protein LOC141617161 n=1 Tax=Silene latifolia TaxID=37657 RepID=UPI003D783A3A